jgi:hypothetical protein
MQFLDKARRVLWIYIELAFLSVLAIILTYFILGQSSGAYIQTVVDNVMKFAGGVPTPSLIGMAIIGLLIYLVVQRTK